VSDKTKTGCRDKLASLRDAKSTAGTVAKHTLTIRQLVDDLMASPPEGWESEQTLSVNQVHADRINSAIGSIRVMDLTARQVEGRLLRPMVEHGYAKTTVIRCRGILRLALRMAQRDYGLAKNAAEEANMPSYEGKPSARVSRSMTVPQVAAMLQAAGITGSPRQGFKFDPTRVRPGISPQWAAYVVVAIMMGLRPGELTGMTWQHTDVDTDARTLAVRHSVKRIGGKLVLSDLKTDSSRDTLIMPRAVVDVLRWHRAEQAKYKLALGAAYGKLGVVFATKVGQPLGRATVRSAFNRLCLKVIGEAYQLRETRHTMVSYLSHNGVSLEAISDLARHKDSTVTRKIYRHVLADEGVNTALAWDGPTDDNPADGLSVVQSA